MRRSPASERGIQRSALFSPLPSRQNARESCAHELAPLIAVEDVRFGETRQRFFEGSTQNDTSIVLDSRHDSTARLARSMIATR
jgi:hypothetical protein